MPLKEENRHLYQPLPFDLARGLSGGSGSFYTDVFFFAKQPSWRAGTLLPHKRLATSVSGRITVKAPDPRETSLGRAAQLPTPGHSHAQGQAEGYSPQGLALPGGQSPSLKPQAGLRMPRGDGTPFLSSLTSRFRQLALPHPTHTGPGSSLSWQSSPHTGDSEARLATEKQQRLLTGAQVRRGSSLNTAPPCQGQAENTRTIIPRSCRAKRSEHRLATFQLQIVSWGPGEGSRVASLTRPGPQGRGTGRTEREGGVSTVSEV